MDWVKIEPGCEMPERREVVAVSGGKDGRKWWTDAVYLGGNQFSSSFDEARFESTHWARVELPNN